MSLSKEEQFLELVKAAQNPLILLPAYPSQDALATGFALGLFFEELGKTPSLGADDLSVKKNELSFLKMPGELLDSISGGRDFVLSFNTEFNPILDVRTERHEKELRIYLTPEHGTIDPRDFSFILAKYKFDLVLTVGSPDKESLGKMYEENPDIFFEVPIINIDTHAGNEQYGQLNIVEVTASSMAEIVACLIEKIGKEFLGNGVAQALLTGIMAATESFQKKNTTPRALEIASKLMEAGADQQKIVKSLYKTQPLNLLKLWGRLMGNLHLNEELHFIWAPVTIEDLVQSRSKMEDLLPALERVRGSFGAASFYAILFQENATTLRLFLKASREDLLEKILAVSHVGKLLGDTVEATLSASSFETGALQIEEWIRQAAK